MKYENTRNKKDCSICPLDSQYTYGCNWFWDYTTGHYGAAYRRNFRETDFISYTFLPMGTINNRSDNPYLSFNGEEDLSQEI
jgi:hypothetical protein